MTDKSNTPEEHKDMWRTPPELFHALNADTSVGWFLEVIQTAHEVRFITGGRISFVRSDTGQQVNGNNKGSMLLIWNPMRRGAWLVSFADRDELMNYGWHIISVKQRAA